MGKQYDTAIRLIRQTSKNIADLRDLLKSPAENDLTDAERKALQIALLKLVVVVKEFNK